MVCAAAPKVFQLVGSFRKASNRSFILCQLSSTYPLSMWSIGSYVAILASMYVLWALIADIPLGGTISPNASSKIALWTLAANLGIFVILEHLLDRKSTRL